MNERVSVRSDPPTSVGKHTIVLLQTSDKRSRTYLTYDTVKSFLEGMMDHFETKLKKDNRRKGEITYDISDLLDYIDSLKDISAMVFDNRTSSYQPHGREWIKKRLEMFLNGLAF